jgi:alkaline phosphatase D
MKTLLSIFLGACFLGGCTSQTTQVAGPYQSMGIKIGEVTDNSAIIWTRLNRDAQRVGIEGGMPEVNYLDRENRRIKNNGSRRSLRPVVTFPTDGGVSSVEGAVPGIFGDVCVRYKPTGALMWASTDWRAVDAEADYTCQVELFGLKTNTQYVVKIDSRGADGVKGQTVRGGLLTAPAKDRAERVVFTVTTGQAYGDQDIEAGEGGGYKIYGQILKLNPSFFVHTGDIVYYDNKAKSLDMAKWHWQRMYSLPTNVRFHNRVSSYFIKDDHDTWMNDCWPAMTTKFMGDFTFDQGVKLFPHMVPMGEKTWRSYRWGEDLQVWFVEGRDFRSSNDMPDGPDKTIWGTEQKEWFRRTVAESDATFRLLISPTPVIGPDRTAKNDNHSNSGFAFEGNELREFMASQKNMYIVCGDRHWQYVSEYKKTGLREYSCGPASNEHAGGWSNDKRYPEHCYLNVTGGFLAGTVERRNDRPVLIFRFYSVDGEVLYEDVLTAK